MTSNKTSICFKGNLYWTILWCRLVLVRFSIINSDLKHSVLWFVPSSIIVLHTLFSIFVFSNNILPILIHLVAVFGNNLHCFYSSTTVRYCINCLMVSIIRIVVWIYFHSPYLIQMISTLFVSIIEIVHFWSRFAKKNILRTLITWFRW